MKNRIKSELLNLGLKFISIDEKLIKIFLETNPSNVNEIVIVPTVKSIMKKLINKLANLSKKGRVYNGLLNNVRVSIIRCYLGCPNMAILLECLRRTKAKKIIRIDICGGITGLTNNVDIGDIIIPNLAYCGDGTSTQYILTYPDLANQLESIENPMGQFQNIIAGSQKIFITKPDEQLNNILSNHKYSELKALTKKVDLWSTDALFCETYEFLNALKSKNIETLDMESSILFLLGKKYNIQTSSILSVSDLPGTNYDFLNSNEIHPNMEIGIDRAIKILINSLPKIKQNI
ncbi:MAG: hypothetical protein KGD57_06970 [Candidatus Lokiarchaeota archaeon]|nr:hypothetical protein [Candidatus Lokiarchaeota archaeon]